MNWLRQKIPTKSSYIEKRGLRENGQMGYLFHITGISYLNFFKDILPYLVIKKERLKLVIKWTEMRLKQGNNEPANSEKFLTIVKTIRHLNSSKLRAYKEVQ